MALYPARHQRPDPQAAQKPPRRPARRHPARQRATDASLRARLTAALDRNKQLADENARLRRQLARALGDQRSARTRSGNDQRRETARSGRERLVGDTVHDGTPQVTAPADAKAQDNVGQRHRRDPEPPVRGGVAQRS